MTGTCIILTACGSEETAQTIVEALVDQSLAACATIIPGARTYYAFRGSTRWDDEFQVQVHTTEDRFDAVAKVINQLHTYEVPEILMLKADQGSEDSEEWIRGMGRGWK